MNFKKRDEERGEGTRCDKKITIIFGREICSKIAELWAKTTSHGYCPETVETYQHRRSRFSQKGHNWWEIMVTKAQLKWPEEPTPENARSNVKNNGEVNYEFCTIITHQLIDSCAWVFIGFGHHWHFSPPKTEDTDKRNVFCYDWRYKRIIESNQELLASMYYIWGGLHGRGQDSYS